uniref:Uncharacterized protein n=1 Tax=Rhizophora mucronata TaxID=61149 RepID=A0A2P2R4K7_RHIMU
MSQYKCFHPYLLLSFILTSFPLWPIHNEHWQRLVS